MGMAVNGTKTCLVKMGSQEEIINIMAYMQGKLFNKLPL